MSWIYDLQTTAQSATIGSSRASLIQGLSAGALGLIGTVVTISYGWIRDRDALATRTRQLDEANKRVTFWESWFRAIEPLDSGNDKEYWRERARTEMWFASVAIEELFRKDSANSSAYSDPFEIYVKHLPTWRRWFLLYQPQRSRAWIPRLIFYLYLLGPLMIPIQLHFRDVQRGEYLHHLEDKATNLELLNSTDRVDIEELAQVRNEIDSFKYRSSRDSVIGYPLVIFQCVFSIMFSILFRSWSIKLEKVVPVTPNPPKVVDSENMVSTPKRKFFFWSTR